MNSSLIGWIVSLTLSRSTFARTRRAMVVRRAATRKARRIALIVLFCNARGITEALAQAAAAPARLRYAAAARPRLLRSVIRRRLVVEELRDVVSEDELEVADRAVALLTDDDLSDAFLFRVLVVDLVAVDEADDVGILLDRS